MTQGHTSDSNNMLHKMDLYNMSVSSRLQRPFRVSFRPLGLPFVLVSKLLMFSDIDCGPSRLGQIFYALASNQNDRSEVAVPSQSILEFFSQYSHKNLVEIKPND